MIVNDFNLGVFMVLKEWTYVLFGNKTIIFIFVCVCVSVTCFYMIIHYINSENYN